MRTTEVLGIIIKMDNILLPKLSRRAMLLLHLEEKSIYVNLRRENTEYFMKELERKLIKQTGCIKPWPCLLTFCFDEEGVPSLYMDSMNLVQQQQQGGLRQRSNQVTTNWGKEKAKRKQTFGASGCRLGDAGSRKHNNRAPNGMGAFVNGGN